MVSIPTKYMSAEHTNLELKTGHELDPILFNLNSIYSFHNIGQGIHEWIK